jgi:hypothetical protein
MASAKKADAIGHSMEATRDHDASPFDELFLLYLRSGKYSGERERLPNQGDHSEPSTIVV